MNAMDLRRGINMAVDSVVEHLKSRAKMISTSEEIAQVPSYLSRLHIAKILCI
jgi:chaperonin GroEL